jgi:ABC-type bacteriocin/lantibiotic exporter with double-glycine peptidase domain
LFLLVLFKNIANYVIQSKGYKIDAEVGQRFTACLLRGYLDKSFLYFLNTSSTETLRNLEAGKMITSHLLRPAIDAGVQVFGIILIVLVLFLTNPIATALTLGGLASLSLLIYRYLGNKFRAIGSTERTLIVQRTKSGNNAILGIRDIKVARRENEFLNRYISFDVARTRFQVKGQVLNEITPMALETLVAFSLVCVSLVFWFMKLENQELATFIALFAVGSLRLVPNFAKIISMKQMTLYGESYVSKVIDDLEDIEKGIIANIQTDKKRLNEINRDESIEATDIHDKFSIIFDKVGFKYPTSKDNALIDIDLTFESGMAIGVIGKSGAGKSTLIDLLLGLLSPTSGNIFVGGRSIAKAIEDRQLVVGYVPQMVYFTEGTIKENIAFGIDEENIEEELIREVVHLSELDGLVAVLPNGLDTPMGELGKLVSGGERQRIGIARALYRRPNLLVLDEATSSLDVQTEAAIVQTISNLNGKITTVTIAHRLSTIEHCQKVVVIDNGTVVRVGDPIEVIPEYLKKMSE